MDLASVPHGLEESGRGDGREMDWWKGEHGKAQVYLGQEYANTGLI